MTKKQKEQLYDFLMTRRCECCGKKDDGWNRRLTFHHIEPADKKKDIGSLSTNKDIIEEIEKCAIVCRSCHTKYFHPQMDGFTHFYKKRKFLTKPTQGEFCVSKNDLMARDFYKEVLNRQYCECCGEKKNLHRYVHPKRRAYDFDNLRIEDINNVASVHMLCSKCVTKTVLKYQGVK